MNCSCILGTPAIHGGRTAAIEPFYPRKGQGWVHGVSSSEVRRSGTRAKEH